jgi:hypothetical protein
MGERPFVIEDLTEIAGIDPDAARRASVEIRSVLLRWLANVFLRGTSPMGAEPASERAGFIARMPVAQSSASKTPRVKLLQDGLAQDVGIALGGAGRARSFA